MSLICATPSSALTLSKDGEMESSTVAERVAEN
jgi:hypothetical protein